MAIARRYTISEIETALREAFPKYRVSVQRHPTENGLTAAVYTGGVGPRLDYVKCFISEDELRAFDAGTLMQRWVDALQAELYRSEFIPGRAGMCVAELVQHHACRAADFNIKANHLAVPFVDLRDLTLELGARCLRTGPDAGDVVLHTTLGAVVVEGEAGRRNTWRFSWKPNARRRRAGARECHNCGAPWREGPCFYCGVESHG